MTSATHPTDELLDLVDKDDNTIGKALRSEIYAKGCSNFRVVNAFVVNSKGELWIPRRTPTKKIFPLCLDMSMGGHVESGETYEDAFRRETQEELNIEIDSVSYRLLGKLTPMEHNVSAFMKVYEIKMEQAPKYNPKDFIEYFWLTTKALLQKLQNGEKSKGDLPKLVKIFYGEV